MEPNVQRRRVSYPSQRPMSAYNPDDIQRLSDKFDDKFGTLTETVSKIASEIQFNRPIVEAMGTIGDKIVRLEERTSTNKDSITSIDRMLTERVTNNERHVTDRIAAAEKAASEQNTAARAECRSMCETIVKQYEGDKNQSRWAIGLLVGLILSVGSYFMGRIETNSQRISAVERTLGSLSQHRETEKN